MCGNFDGQRFNEYEGPMKTVYERPEHSVIKYTIPSAECSLSNLITKHNVPSDSVYSGMYNAACILLFRMAATNL